MKASRRKKVAFFILPLILLLSAEGAQRLRFYWKSDGNSKFLFWGGPGEIQKLNPDFRKLPRWLPKGHTDFEGVVDLRPGDLVPQDDRVFRINNLGMIGEDIPREKPSDLRRILVLGDVTSFVIFDSENKWPEELQQVLNRHAKEVRFQVLNGAFEGHNSFHLKHLFFQFGWLDLEPDLIIIYSGLFDFADLMENLMEVKSFEQFRFKRFFLKVSGSISDRSLLYATVKERVLRYLFESVEKGYAAMGEIIQESELTPEEDARRKARIRKKSEELSEVLRDSNKFFDSEAYQEWRGHFVKNFDSVVGTAREKGIPVIFLKPPFIPGPDTPEGAFWWRYFPDTIVGAIDELVARHEVHSIDLQNFFQTVPDKRALFTHHWAGGFVHPSRKGAQVIAEYLTNEIRGLGLFSEQLSEQ